ncbi:MAG: gamma-glutamyltransferase, partial [Verrucomicrobia bacterium]|nr:gamma-glutamyltransferase [Verrucomicrobiota bacterium]
GANAPTLANNGMVVSANDLSSEIGINILKQGGSAVDAAVATAFALAVTHPSAGNIGGGGFLVYRPDEGEPVAYDFREVAPEAAFPEMWLVDGEYSAEKHHQSYWSIGVPGTVAGLYLAWQDHGNLKWKQLLQPAIDLARKGIVVTHRLSESLKRALPRMEKYPASFAKFTNKGTPYEAGDVWKQPELASSLKRIASKGPDGFYKGKTAELIVAEMEANDGLITLEDLANYEPKKRKPVLGNYRGYEVISMPPPSSGGTTLVEMLNILEAYPLSDLGFGSADTLHLMTEAMRRAFEDRARFLGDPDFDPDIPLERLLSKDYAKGLRGSIDLKIASVSSPERFKQLKESIETTHFSVVDKDRNAVALTYTLEVGYGSAIVVPGTGFLLNNEMGDFNAGPGLTNDQGLIGTPANLAEPGKRMLSSMTPTILEKEGELFMVIGTPGGRTIINTVMQTIINVVDHGMNAQAAVDAGRIHHQWMPDKIYVEAQMFSPDTLRMLEARGHTLVQRTNQGSAEIIVYNFEEGILEGGVDRRVPDGGAATW